jgi:5-methyltetrahydrofolate--homocysteine methyltransferase
MNRLKQILDEKKILISDGAWGTELFKLGLKAGDVPEKLNLENPEIVEQVAKSYVNAGADIIITNTFSGSKFKLKRANLESKVYEVNCKGVEISKKAAGEKVMVFGSIGPTGEFMQPLGTVKESEMIECFAEQVKAFSDAKTDGIVIETMSDINEAKTALKAIKDFSDLFSIVSITYSKTKNGFATMMGITPEKAIEELTNTGLDMIGSNCGGGINDFIEIVKLYKNYSDLPMWIKPNAGLPKFIDGKTIYEETPEAMASKVSELINAGANIIGGCCGTTPTHIEFFVKERDKMLS